MTQVANETPRRSSRVFMRIRVVAAGKNLMGRKFRETCHTIVINAHGALIYLQQEMEMESEIVLSNPFTQEEQECRVVFLGEEDEKGQRIGVEFLSPSPRFWGVDFTPSDWHADPPAPPAA
jgi:hypothetical protein